MVSQIKVNEIIKQSGSTITIGESGDTVTIPSGATLNSVGTTTLASGQNMTPAFAAEDSGDQSIPNGTNTKLTFDTEYYDSDGTWDTSNSRWTPGIAGKNCINATVYMQLGTDGKYVALFLYKNGSNVETIARQHTGVNDDVQVNGNISFVATATDYYEIYVHQNSGGSKDTSATQTRVNGFKVMGA
jgi:hypothetical protein